MGKAKERLERLLEDLNASTGAIDPDGVPATVDVIGDDENDYPYSEFSSISDVTGEGSDGEGGGGGGGGTTPGRSSARDSGTGGSDKDRRRLADAIVGAGTVYTGRLEQKVQQRTAKLEERLAVLVEENRKKDFRHAEALAAKEREFSKERESMLAALTTLKEKHADLEKHAPPLRRAIDDAKDKLRKLVCSQERMHELQATPESKLSLQEFCIMRVHQETASLREELNVARLERDNARDAAARVQLDNERLVRDAKRANASISASEQESAAERAALDSRNDRLARELEDAMVKVEVLSAKGAMYDEVASSVDRLTKRAAEAEKAKAVAVGAEELLRKEKDALAAQLASRQHQLDLLVQDKAYLSREVETCRGRERKHEEEEDRLREKVRALKQARNELQERLMSGADEIRSQHEERLTSEVTRLQHKAADDLERLREEHAAARDREIRALRDLRDAAVSDAAVARNELSDARRAHDELLSQHRTAQKNADVSHAELSGQLRMRAMELERVASLREESASQVKMLQLECEMLTKKVRLLEGQYHTLEAAANRRQGDAEMRLAEQSARLEHYEALERELDDAVLTAAATTTTTTLGDGDGGSSEGESGGGGIVAGGGSGGEGGGGGVGVFVGGAGSALNALGSSVPASLRRRLQQSIALGRRVKELEKQCAMACDSRDAAMSKVEGLEAQLRRATARASDAAQPYNYLVERISAAEGDADAAAGREREARSELEEAKAKLAAAREESDALRRDLKRALDERSELASIKAMLRDARTTSSAAAAGRKAVRA